MHARPEGPSLIAVTQQVPTPTWGPHMQICKLDISYTIDYGICMPFMFTNQTSKQGSMPREVP